MFFLRHRFRGAEQPVETACGVQLPHFFHQRVSRRTRLQLSPFEFQPGFFGRNFVFEGMGHGSPSLHDIVPHPCLRILAAWFCKCVHKSLGWTFSSSEGIAGCPNRSRQFALGFARAKRPQPWGKDWGRCRGAAERLPHLLNAERCNHVPSEQEIFDSNFSPAPR